MDKKKRFAWFPDNVERFYDTFDSIEEAVADAQDQFDNKYEMYEDYAEFNEETDDPDDFDLNSTDITICEAEKYNVDKFLNRFGENLIDMLNEDLGDFMFGVDCDSDVYCQPGKIGEFFKEVKSALKPLIDKYLIFYMDELGHSLALTYNVKTRKYKWNDVEYDEVPAEYKEKFNY